MRAIVVWGFVALVGCSNGRGPIREDWPDVPWNDDACICEAACNVLMQTGCNVGEHCTWFVDDLSLPPLGHITCGPAGTVAIGAACTVGPPGATGHDDCVAGAVCIAGTCAAICDLQGGIPTCSSGLACAVEDGVFSGATYPPVAGVCKPS